MLLAVEGLQLSAGVSEHEQANRLLNERLFTIEWEQRELPEISHIDAGSWLLLSDSGTDPLTVHLGKALNSDGAQCITAPLPLGKLGSQDSATLRSLLRGERPGRVVTGTGRAAPCKALTGVVVVTAPPPCAPDGWPTSCGAAETTCRTWSRDRPRTRGTPRREAPGCSW